MAVYQINKGIGRSPEFKGLRSQYLFIFAGGLLAVLITFMILYMVGVNQWVCIILGVIFTSVLVWAIFRLNAKYGEWGMMKMLALFIKKHRIGRMIRAVSNNTELCDILGINSNKVILFAFVISSVLAAIAGILVAYDTDIIPSMGFNLLFYGVVAMIIGGVGSIWE